MVGSDDGDTQVWQVVRVLRVSRYSEMGNSMHIASGWETQESLGHGVIGNGGVGATDSSVEQGLEVARVATRNGEGAWKRR